MSTSTAATSQSTLSFLPGPVCDRTRWTGWDRWRRTRGDFIPAPMTTLDSYQRMSPRQRRIYDLHRLATHSNLIIQETPMSAQIAWRLRALIEDNALAQGPDTRPGMMINGGACQGKTETVCETIAGFEDDWLDIHPVNPQTIDGHRDIHAPSYTCAPQSGRHPSRPASGSWTSSAKTTKECALKT